MSESKISYLNRDFDSYKQALIDYTKENYPQIADNLNDASITEWLIDLVASVSDNLSYYIDKAYNETNLDSASKSSSLYALARNNGLKIPGPKGSMTEIKFTCTLPPTGGTNNASNTLSTPNWDVAPIIKKGTRLTTGNGVYFETSEDVDFKEQYDSYGNSNRDVIPLIDSNNNIRSYHASKTVVATAGITKTYKLTVSSDMIVPFMKIVIPDSNVMSVESIILKDGTNFTSDPSDCDFNQDTEFDGSNTYRFFEVNSLADQYVFGSDMLAPETPVKYEYGYAGANSNVSVVSIAKGEWKPITQKFITEFTDTGYLQIIFGSGEQVGQTADYSNATFSAKRQIARMIRNNFLGKLPKVGTTMYIRYRVGGGAASNVAAGTINNISYLKTDNSNSSIVPTITATNTIPAISGKDAPTEDEIRYLIKYNSGAQNRCVTLKDYISRIQQMPPEFGCPYKVSAVEENNKVEIYMLMIDGEGHLTDVIPYQLIRNVQNYLAMYRSLNDFVEIKPGRIINISFEIDLYADKTYNTAEVVKNVISKVKDYMDISKHELGGDVYVGDIEKEISLVDGVLNLIDLRVYNEYGSNYSGTRSQQATVEMSEEYTVYTGESTQRSQLDLQDSDYILNSYPDEMLEVKYDTDIVVRVKTR